MRFDRVLHTDFDVGPVPPGNPEQTIDDLSQREPVRPVDMRSDENRAGRPNELETAVGRMQVMSHPICPDLFARLEPAAAAEACHGRLLRAVVYEAGDVHLARPFELNLDQSPNTTQEGT